MSVRDVTEALIHRAVAAFNEGVEGMLDVNHGRTARVTTCCSRQDWIAQLAPS